jgi:hypothetical protein
VLVKFRANTGSAMAGDRAAVHNGTVQAIISTIRLYLPVCTTGQAPDRGSPYGAPGNDLARWDGGLAVDFGTGGLCNSPGGSTWNKVAGWDAEVLEGRHDGLYADFGGYGLW